ncbi:MAG: RraA family protein, partial [Bacillota bacterium]
DNLMLHKAVDMFRPGDVLVVDTGGDRSRAVIGGLMGRRAQSMGLAGLVVDGLVRDIQDLRSLGLGVWARGVTPAGPYKNGPGEIGFPVSIGGIPINAGDLIVADDDGVICVRYEDMSEVLSAAQAVVTRESNTLEGLKKGVTPDRTWVDSTLECKGCEWC